MPDISKDLILLLQYLLPGFLVAWIYFGWTSHQKPSQFERVVQALIFACIVQLLVRGVRLLLLKVGTKYSIGIWDADSELLVSVVGAIAIGMLAAFAENKDWLHSHLRDWGISKRSSHPSEWCTVFDKNPHWVIVELKDERRILGWPEIWPADPSKGHMLITRGAWQPSASDVGKEDLKYVTGSDEEVHVLIDVADIKWVQFLKG